MYNVHIAMESLCTKFENLQCTLHCWGLTFDEPASAKIIYDVILAFRCEWVHMASQPLSHCINADTTNLSVYYTYEANHKLWLQ